MSIAFPIRNENDYKRALILVDELWDAEPGSREADVLDVMATLIAVYEKERRTLPLPDPIALIEFKLRELEWSQRELGRRLGWGSGRVSEILSRKRPLTLRMVQELGAVLGLPSGMLVPDLREVRMASAESTAPATPMSPLREGADSPCDPSNVVFASFTGRLSDANRLSAA